tara:strand:- start:1500 stop:1799 length:300 start_codon:yes stop_codon:yes gene_type:complete
MKLTQERLLEIIQEEIGNFAEQENVENSSDDQQKGVNLASLGDEMIEAGRAIKGSKVRGLDMNEIKLVSAILANVLEVASEKSSGTLLARLNDLIEKNK